MAQSHHQSQRTPADADDAIAGGAEEEAEEETAAPGGLVGSYRLASLRSRTAGCQVWNAIHRPTEMDVVVEIYPKTGDDKRLVESIVHKLDRFVELANCQVLRLLEVMDSEAAIFLVYEHYSEQSLEQYVLNCPLNGKEFQRLVKSLIKTVQKLHNNCFFHGTLNADCFVLTRQKKIKFKDAPNCHMFVRSDIEPSKFDALMSKASDVWSLGALIYRLIASQLDRLQLPSGSVTAEAVTHMIAGLSPALFDLLARMTDQNPTARIGTADCLRHPYLLASASLLHHLAPARSPASSARSKVTRWPAVSRDVVRFLARATGAPEAGIADAVANNDLSSWSAAYWLLRQRITAGCGFPALISSDATTAAATTDEATSLSQASAAGTTPAAVTAAAAAVAATTAGSHHQGFRRTLRQLRDQRLGLRSPDAAAAMTTTSGGGGGNGGPSTASSGRRGLRWGLRHAGDATEDDENGYGNAAPTQLPPIQGGPAPSQPPLATSRFYRGGGGGGTGAQQQKLPVGRRPQQHYLSYLGGGGESQRPSSADDKKAPAEAAAGALNNGNNSNRGDSRGASSGIRVNVLQRSRELDQKQLLSLPPVSQSQQQQQQQQQHQDNRQTSTLTQWSPRQPPNSRTELAAPGDYAEAAVAAAAAAAVAGQPGGLAGSDDEAEFQQPETVYLWENALVRRQEWMSARAF